jgi:hypothetical protein
MTGDELSSALKANLVQAFSRPRPVADMFLMPTFDQEPPQFDVEYIRPRPIMLGAAGYDVDWHWNRLVTRWRRQGKTP